MEARQLRQKDRAGDATEAKRRRNQDRQRDGLLGGGWGVNREWEWGRCGYKVLGYSPTLRTSFKR